MNDRIIININTSPCMGLTTNTFMECIKCGYIDYEDVIRWASNNGFSWIEVRDPEVKMSYEQLRKLKILGDNLNVRLHYGWNNSDFLNLDNQAFKRAIENAEIFGEGTHCRTVIAPKHILDEDNKKGYTKDEYEKILKLIHEYILYAQKFNIILCFENSYEPLCGDGITYFGMSEFLQNCRIMMTTLDIANFMNKEQVRVLSHQDEVLDYYRRYFKQIPYFHLKITSENVLRPVVDCDGDFDLKLLFESFVNNPEILVCLELPSHPELDIIKQNILSSIEYMRNKSLIV